jgi:hypothetical protein
MADLTNEERIAQQITPVVPVAPVQPVQVGNAGLAIQGIKFNDRNADGIRQPGEEGLPNVTILLEPGTSSNGTFNAGAGEAVTHIPQMRQANFLSVVKNVSSKI